MMGEMGAEFRRSLLYDLYYYKNIVEKGEEEEAEEEAFKKKEEEKEKQRERKREEGVEELLEEELEEGNGEQEEGGEEEVEEEEGEEGGEEEVEGEEGGEESPNVSPTSKLLRRVRKDNSPSSSPERDLPGGGGAGGGGGGGKGLSERASQILEFLSQVDAEDEEEEEDVGVDDGGGGGGEETAKKKKKVEKVLRFPRAPKNKFRFCPWCSNLLQVHHSGSKRGGDSWRWKCVTCPYNLPVLRRHRYLTWKEKNAEEEEDQIVELAKANEHRQRTEILCPSCDHKEAYFYQMQTRSADEPMTTFYECVSRTCGHHWRD